LFFYHYFRSRDTGGSQVHQLHHHDPLQHRPARRAAQHLRVKTCTRPRCLRELLLHRRLLRHSQRGAAPHLEPARVAFRGAARGSRRDRAPRGVQERRRPHRRVCDGLHARGGRRHGRPGRLRERSDVRRGSSNIHGSASFRRQWQSHRPRTPPMRILDSHLQMVSKQRRWGRSQSSSATRSWPLRTR